MNSKKRKTGKRTSNRDQERIDAIVAYAQIVRSEWDRSKRGKTRQEMIAYLATEEGNARYNHLFLAQELAEIVRPDPEYTGPARERMPEHDAIEAEALRMCAPFAQEAARLAAYITTTDAAERARLLRALDLLGMVRFMRSREAQRASCPANTLEQRKTFAFSPRGKALYQSRKLADDVRGLIIDRDASEIPTDADVVGEMLKAIERGMKMLRECGEFASAKDEADYAWQRAAKQSHKPNSEAPQSDADRAAEDEVDAAFSTPRSSKAAPWTPAIWGAKFQKPNPAPATPPKPPGPPSFEETLFARRDLRLRADADPRPSSIEEVIGQDEALEAARVILNSNSPTHMIFQGPPGIGKTTIGRIALQMAIDSGTSRFAPDAPFVEVNCSNIQGDERYSLNPIVSSVVDGYYSNVADRNKQNNHPTDMPQINLGATAHAHGGVLFLDEIGELPTWMQNGLLKVLEDKREQIRAARYDATNNKYPEWLHYFFQEGIPADFILIGATTRDPSELTPALRSRCEIIRFRSLDASERATIATNAAIKYGCTISVQAALLIASQTDSGRDAARRVQVAVSRAAARNSTHIEADDVPPGISQLPPRAICARDGCHIISEFKRHVCLRCNIRLRPAKAQPACTCGQPAKYSVAIVSELEATEDVCEKCRSLIGLAGIALPIITSPGGGDTAMGARL